MSKVTASYDFDRLSEDDRTRYITLFCEQLVRVVNGSLDFETNFNSKFVSINFSSANSDSSVSHGLGRVPSGYIIVGLSAAMIVYDGSVASTASNLTLKSSATGSARLLVY